MDTTTPTLGQEVQVVRCDDGAIATTGQVFGIFGQAVAIVCDDTGECIRFTRRQSTSFKADGYFCVVRGVRYRVNPI